VQLAKAAPSRLQAKAKPVVSSGSLAWNVKLALVAFVGFVGWLSMVVVGAVMSTV
jgi:hypothetical protein